MDNTKKVVSKAAPFTIVLIAVVGIILLIVGLPVIMIGAIDYNLQKVLGFSNTVGILEKQGEYVTAEMLANGEVPENYANDLAVNGIEVGQITTLGEFIRTNVYIADIESRDDLVASLSGVKYISEAEGELAINYNDKIIRSGDFVAAVETDPKLYMAYSDAANIASKYYYGKDVEQVYKDMGLSRGNFNDWDYSGSYEADEEEYQKILTKVLDNKAGLGVGGYHKDEPEPVEDGVESSGITLEDSESSGATWTKNVTNGSAEEIISTVGENTKEYIVRWGKIEYQTVVNGNMVTRVKWGPIYSNQEGEDNATRRAAELLNTAVSSGEPYLASNAFIATLEAIQRARVDGDGPVNHVMNSLTEGTEVEYQDVSTGEMKTSNLSILETDNFRAAVSDSSYSTEEANNFGRDRVLQTTGEANAEVISKTTIGTNGKTNSSTVVRNGKYQDEADRDTIMKAEENVAQAITTNNSELFQSVVGGNRIIEGGSYLSNTINMRVIGAMPSGAEAISEYNKEVEEVMARKAEAERATLSPFDISSPNTFFGNLVNKLGVAAVSNYTGSIGTSLKVASSVAGQAVSNLTSGAKAEGANQTYTTLSGTNCVTVETVGIEGDLYCSSHNTPSTGYMNYTLDDWKGTVVGSSLDDEGNFTDGSEGEQFVTIGMSRFATVGVKSAEVCEMYKEYNPGSIFTKIRSLFSNMKGLYDACEVADADNPKIATGAAYSFGAEADPDKHTELYAGYVLYNEVKSLLTETTSAVSDARNRYYEKHPLDNSEAGVVARYSGMTKDEAEIALAYSDYLNVIANYDASDVYVFNAPLVSVEQPILEIHSNETASYLYAWRQKETEYADVRNRNFVA